jgi:hypothetical protein
MNDFNDLKNSPFPEDHITYGLFVSLTDQIFSQHDQIIIDMATENEKNHELIKVQWKMIKKYFKVPDNCKYVQKCVRQTFIHIVDFLNKKYQFKTPIRLEHKRIDSYDRTIGHKFTKHWIEISY